MEVKEENKDSISMVEANLPPGFRFHPRDDELVCDYLMQRTVRSLYRPTIVLIDVDLNKCEPWDIPQTARVGGKEWYFYSQKDRKYATGQRTNRATKTGYWKATGKDRSIQRDGSLVGMRKTLVFYRGRAPKGLKTDWVMHEFRLHGTFLQHSLKEEWVLCRVFNKNTNEVDKDNNNNIRNCSYETDSTLMDSYMNFDHHHIINQQVPCFSNLSQNQTNQTGLVFKNPNPLFSPSSDQMVLRALLNQLTKSAKESESYGEGSSESQMTNPWK
ncbi:unnamed protein product [Cochlearia groenlandica]